MNHSEILHAIVSFARTRRPEIESDGTDLSSLPVHRVFDSIGMVDFLTFLEQTFQIRISDADVLPANFRDFSSVARLVESKRLTP